MQEHNMAILSQAEDEMISIILIIPKSRLDEFKYFMEKMNLPETTHDERWIHTITIED